jgi:hypothetical protein
MGRYEILKREKLEVDMKAIDAARAALLFPRALERAAMSCRLPEGYIREDPAAIASSIYSYQRFGVIRTTAHEDEDLDCGCPIGGYSYNDDPDEAHDEDPDMSQHDESCTSCNEYSICQVKDYR